MVEQFHPLTQQYLKNVSLDHRKKFGQYFTPKSIREALLEHLPRLKNPAILDPACGTGEFLLTASALYPNAELTGWEIDPKLCRLSRKIVPQAAISKKDALAFSPRPSFDLIIGNPPYYEYQPDEPTKNRFHEVLYGRTNIFTFFVKQGLDLLHENGYLAFVIPPSMNNGAYFSRLREYIIAQADIHALELVPSPHLFDKALQSVMLLILQKRPNRGKYLFSRNNITIFSPNAAKLRAAFKNKTTFYEKSYRVATGKIVWNQHRSRLTDSSKQSVPLIWAHHIKQGQIERLSKPAKPNFIKTDSADTGPAIVVNRITGSTGQSCLRAALVPPQYRFVAENHVNVIYPPQKTNPSKLKDIVRQLNSPSLTKTINFITGNTQLSKTELAQLLPLEL